MRTFLIGTDWWTDCDDVVAMRILARAAKYGQIKIAGIGINACMEYSVPSLDGFLSTEGLSGIPLGIDKDATDFGENPPYQKRLAQYCTNYQKNEAAEDCVRLYRRILASSEEKLEIIQIGILQVIAAVLESGADDISEKTGLELVQEKVSKFWVMAGKWDAEGGSENNFCRSIHSRKAARIFCEKCPVPVTFFGHEVGIDVISGGHLDETDVLHKAMCDHGSPNGCSSCDPMLVMLALNGSEEASGYTTVQGNASVTEDSGQNYFTESDTGLHKYVIRKFEPGYYEKMIDTLISSEAEKGISCPICASACQQGDHYCSVCGFKLPNTPIDQSPKKKGSLWPPILIMVAMFAVSLVVYFVTCSGRSSVPKNGDSYFNVENNILYFDPSLYSGGPELVIPETVDGQTVLGIGEYCFADCDELTTVFLPGTVTEIGEGAFWDCGSLRGVYIPESVVTIGEYAFAYCTDLEAICILNPPAFIGEYTFDSCDNLHYILFGGNYQDWSILYDGFINPYAYVYCSDGVFPQGGTLP